MLIYTRGLQGMPSPLEALTAALGDVGIEKLEEAGVKDYITSALEDCGEDDEEIADLIAPMLLDTGAAESEEHAGNLCAAVLDALRNTESRTKHDDAPRALSTGPVSMHALVQADDAAVSKAAAKAIGGVQINYNSELGSKGMPNSLIEEDESEEAMKRRFKQAKRGEKRLKREIRRERTRGMQAEEFMKELTREPVVLHWRGGTGAKDILLKGVSMDVNGLPLLEDCDVSHPAAGCRR